MGHLRSLLLCAPILLHPALSAAQTPPPPPGPAAQPGAAPAPPAVPAPPGAYPVSGYPPPLGAYAYPGAMPPPARLKTHSPALMGGGIALVALGGLSLIGAGTAFVVDAGSRGDFQGVLSLIVGIPLVAHGLGCIAGGVPMIVIGKRQIPVEGPTYMPTLVPARGGAGMRWTF